MGVVGCLWNWVGGGEMIYNDVLSNKPKNVEWGGKNYMRAGKDRMHFSSFLDLQDEQEPRVASLAVALVQIH